MICHSERSEEYNYILRFSQDDTIIIYPTEKNKLSNIVIVIFGEIDNDISSF